MMTKQKFTLDTSAILSEKDFANTDIQQSLKDFLIEGYNPLIEELVTLAQKNPSMTKSDSRLQTLSKKLESMIKDSGYTYEQKEREISGSSNSMSTHLAFIIKEIEAGNPIGTTLKSLSDNLTGQTKKDLEAGRIHFDLIDQDGKPFLLDGNPNLSEAVAQRAKANNTSFTKAFQDALNLTDGQLNLMLCRYNQRGIEGAGMALITKHADNGPRFNNIYVTVEKGEIKRVDAVENIYTVQKPLFEEITLKDGRQEISPVTDENDNPVKVPVSRTTYRVDLQDLPNIPLALPTQKTKETLTFEALDEDAIYPLPKALKARTTNNKLLSSANKLEENEVASLMSSPGIKSELTEANYSKLTSLVTSKVVEMIVENEFKKIQLDNPKANNAQITQTLQASIANIFDKTKMTNDRELNKHLSSYVEMQKPSLLTKVSNYIHAAFHGLSITTYQENKKDRASVRAANLLLKNKEEQRPRAETSPSKHRFSRSTRSQTI